MLTVNKTRVNPWSGMLFKCKLDSEERNHAHQCQFSTDYFAANRLSFLLFSCHLSSLKSQSSAPELLNQNFTNVVWNKQTWSVCEKTPSLSVVRVLRVAHTEHHQLNKSYWPRTEETSKRMTSHMSSNGGFELRGEVFLLLSEICKITK